MLLAVSTIGCFDAAADLEMDGSTPSDYWEITDMNESKSGVKLELQQKPAEESEGQVVVTATLRNDGKGPMWVNKRMLWNNPNATAKFRELWFEVVAVDGKALQFGCKVNAGFSKQKDYTTLQPQENVTVTIRLSRCYKLDKGGPFKVKAFYQDSNAEEHKAPDGTPQLEEMLTSNVIEIRL